MLFNSFIFVSNGTEGKAWETIKHNFKKMPKHTNKVKTPDYILGVSLIKMESILNCIQMLKQTDGSLIWDTLENSPEYSDVSVIDVGGLYEKCLTPPSPNSPCDIRGRKGAKTFSLKTKTWRFADLKDTKRTDLFIETDEEFVLSYGTMDLLSYFANCDEAFEKLKLREKDYLLCGIEECVHHFHFHYRSISIMSGKRKSRYCPEYGDVLSDNYDETFEESTYRESKEELSAFVSVYENLGCGYNKIQWQKKGNYIVCEQWKRTKPVHILLSNWVKLDSKHYWVPRWNPQTKWKT